jgi:transposase
MSSKQENQRYAGIDIGVNNLAVIVTNTGDKPLIINGKPLNLMNHYYNQKKARLQSRSKLDGCKINPEAIEAGKILRKAISNAFTAIGIRQGVVVCPIRFDL